MAKQKQKGTKRELSALRIPSERDWGDYLSDLDQKWAHDHYCGRSNEEMQGYFHNNSIESASDLWFMPEVPFRYYMLGYRDYVMSARLLDDPDAASCFLNLVSRKLEQQPRYIAPIMEQLLSAIEFVATHQSEYDADESIYGNFLEKLNRIRALHVESSKGIAAN